MRPSAISCEAHLLLGVGDSPESYGHNHEPKAGEHGALDTKAGNRRGIALCEPEHGGTSHGKIVYHVTLKFKTWARCPTGFLGEL